MTDIHRLSATELAGLYRRRALSPVEAARAILDRIERLQPKLNAFCHLDPAGTLATARESEARLNKGEPLGPLDGVPVSVKDLIETRGWPTRHGSRATSPHGPWLEDSPCIASARAAGLVLLGKTTTPEFGHKGVTESGLTGRTSNPWNLGVTPGGSSGGAGAALAAGLGPLAIGTDGGGSCRKPASFCGVVGMKPSFGRIGYWPPSPLYPLSSPGPMARRVKDAALLLAVMQGRDARDPNHHGERLPPLDAAWNLQGARIAFTTTLGGSRTRPAVAKIVEAAMACFRDLGATVTMEDPAFADPMPIYRTLLDSGMASVAAPMTQEQRALLDDSFRPSLERGERVTGVELRHALETRATLIRQMEAFHARYDLLVTPTNPSTAFPHGTREPLPEPGDGYSATVCFTFPFNITGQPAISVPCGETGDGLPVGLQIVGPVGRDDQVLRAAEAFEALSGWNGRLAPLE